jgi:hypothetical protein
VVSDSCDGFGRSEDAALTDDSSELRAYRMVWARLLSKVYEIDPVVCPKRGAEMKVIAIIQEPAEIDCILRHFVK